jgi:hypothetical protein
VVPIPVVRIEVVDEQQQRGLPDRGSRVSPVALRCGLGVETAAELRRAAPGPLLVAAHAGGWLGYLLEPEDYARGGYETCLSFHGRELAPRFVAAAAGVLGRLDAAAAVRAPR